MRSFAARQAQACESEAHSTLYCFQWSPVFDCANSHAGNASSILPGQSLRQLFAKIRGMSLNVDCAPPFRSRNTCQLHWKLSQSWRLNLRVSIHSNLTNPPRSKESQAGEPSISPHDRYDTRLGNLSSKQPRESQSRWFRSGQSTFSKPSSRLRVAGTELQR
jgi:hypothetical protein